MTAIAPAPIAACLAAKAESNKNSIEFKTDNSARGYYSKDYWNSSARYLYQIVRKSHSLGRVGSSQKFLEGVPTFRKISLDSAG